MNGSVVGGEVGRFVTIFDELVGEGKITSESAVCVFFTEI